MICFVVFVSPFYFLSLFSAIPVTSAAAVVWDVMVQKRIPNYIHTVTTQSQPKANPTQPIKKVNGPLTFYQQHSHNAFSVSESALNGRGSK